MRGGGGGGGGGGGEEETSVVSESGAVIGLAKSKGWSHGALFVVVRTVGRAKEGGATKRDARG